jgi:hypothetical protein
MPATSAKKCARQRANKLLKVKSVTEPAVLIVQTPEIVPPPSQSPISTPVIQTSPSPPPTSIDFETFIELADLDDVLRFCEAVATTQGRNLKLLWDRAFEAGLDQGRTEERDFRDEMYRRGKAQGTKEAEEAAKRVEIDLYCHGIEKGRFEENLEWTSAGHGLHCFSPITILSDKSIQTDLEPLVTACDASIQVEVDFTDNPVIPLCVDASTQTPEPPLLVPPQMMNSPPLNWADDTSSLPTQIIPSPPSPRDFSDLRSSKQNPFSSLQHRSKRFIRYSHQSHQSHRSRSHFNSNSLYSPHRNSSKPSQRYFHTKTYSHLNWESDPRLSDLSRSLKALGWIRAS